MRFFSNKKQASFDEDRIAKLLKNVDELPSPLDEVKHLSTQEFRRGIAVADLHGGRFSVDMFNKMLNVSDDGYNDLIIIAGDVSDSTAYSPHQTARKQVVDFSREAENLSLILEVLSSKFKKIAILPGQHDFWINRNLKKGELTFEQIARLYIPPDLLANDTIIVSEMTWLTLDIDKEDPLVVYHSGTYLKKPFAGVERAYFRCLDYYNKRANLCSFHGHETHYALRGADGNKRIWIEAGGLAQRKKNMYPHLWLDDSYRMWSPSFISWERPKDEDPLHIKLYHELSK